MATTYVIIETSEVSSVDFSQVCEDSADTVRYNLDRDKALVKFEGTTPSFLNGNPQYNHAQIRTILTDESQGWYIADTQVYLDTIT